jgi:hypothetical protein
MSKETLLKKEFKKSDVQRIRNLVAGRYGDKTQTQVGYTKTYIERNEGDSWEEDGKQWTIRNGIKINLSKINRSKYYSIIPMFCPKCNKVMKHTNDKKMYVFHKQCSDCVIKYETELKLNGKYEAYENQIIKNNVGFSLDEFIDGFDDFLETIQGGEMFITEQGDVEEWHSKKIDTKKIKEEVMNDIQETKTKLGL